MDTILILLAVFASILLVLVVLIQPGKAEMISGMGGLGGQINNMLGVRTGRNFMQNLTIGLLAAIALLALVVNRVFLSHETQQKSGVTVGREIPTESAPTMAPPAAPSQPAQGTPAPQPKQGQ